MTRRAQPEPISITARSIGRGKFTVTRDRDGFVICGVTREPFFESAHGLIHLGANPLSTLTMRQHGSDAICACGVLGAVDLYAKTQARAGAPRLRKRAGSGCLNRFPRMISGVPPGLAVVDRRWSLAT